MTKKLRRNFYLSAASPLTLILLVSAGCVTHLVLKRHPQQTTGAMGPLQICRAHNQPCITDPNQDGSRFNQSKTVYFQMPNCPYGIEGLLVQNANSPSNPEVIAQCAAPAAENGLLETSDDGGVN